MFRRVASALILLALVLSGFLFESLAWIPVGLIAIIAVMCTLEIAGMLKRKGLRVFRRIASWGVLAMMLEAALTGMEYSIIIFGLAVCLAWVVRMPGEVEGAWGDISTTCFTMAYVGIPLAAMTTIFLSGGEGKAWLLLMMGIIWTSDSAALFVGRKYGTIKMWPKLSPGKTWEGTLGGIGGAVAFAVLAGIFFGDKFPGVGAVEFVIFAILFAIIGILGDLAESLLKRDAGVKDSGTELTGHGGFLDLMDAVLFGALPLLAYIKFFHPGVLGA